MDSWALRCLPASRCRSGPSAKPWTVHACMQLVALTEATAFFQAHEIETLRGALEAYFAGETGHVCSASETEGQLDGYVYLGDADMAARTWYVWWIAVDPSTQGRGVGRELLR